MSELPKVYHNKIDKKINNNSKYYYSANKKEDLKETTDTVDIRKKINDIFRSSNFIYKANVKITTKDKNFTTKIIGRNKNYLITMDNKVISIDDIINIEKK